MRKEFAEGQIIDACLVIAHYHNHHTQDVITRFRSRDGTHIYVTSDKKWKTILAECTVEELGTIEES